LVRRWRRQRKSRMRRKKRRKMKQTQLCDYRLVRKAAALVLFSRKTINRKRVDSAC